MLLILDANEYIFGLGLARKLTCASLLKEIVTSFPENSLRICRTIVDEVRVNLSNEDSREFIKLIYLLTLIDEDMSVPFELGVKYELWGLKFPDAFIAAYTEWTGADILVSENRHFLSRRANLPFRICSAETCLRLIKSSR